MPANNVMSDSNTDTEVVSDDAEQVGLFGRLRRHPLRFGGIFAGVGVLLLGGTVALISLVGGEETEGVSVDELLDLVDQERFEEAHGLAASIEKPDDRTNEEQALIAYTIGRGLIDEAESQSDESKRRALYMIAARYFQESAAKSLPPDRVADGNYFLGMALYHSGLKTQALPAFAKAAEQIASPNLLPELNRYLADIYLSDAELSIDRGLEYNRQYLEQSELSEDEQRQGLLQQADLLSALYKFEEAEQLLTGLLASLPAESLLVFETELQIGKLGIARFKRWSADADLLQDGRLRRQAQNALRDAVQHFEVAARGENTGAAARYYLATCELRLGNLASAADRFGIVRRELVESPLSVPAALGEAEAIQESGDHQLAFKNYLHLLDTASKFQYRDSEWMSAKEFEDRIVEAQLAFRRSGEYELALEFARRSWPTVARDLSMQMQAESYLDWGDRLTNGGTDLNGERIAVDPIAAREKYREAGLAYFKLSKLRLSSPNYLDYLWSSAESYFKGRDYSKAGELYEQYLDEPPETRVARANLRIGEALLSMGRPGEALEAFNKCIVYFPNDSDSYRARVLASQVLMSNNQPEQAKKHLLFNIEESALEPESEIWRDSLFQLGKMVYHEAMLLEIESRELGVDSDDPRLNDEGLAKLQEARVLFQETVVWLAEAVTRYRDEREAIEARYLLAESYRQGAKFPQKRLKNVTISGTRFQLERQINEELAQAYRLYDELETDLTRAQDERELNVVEKSILRNCSFAKADVLFDQQDYEGAIAAYQTVSSRYHNRPESLEAFCRTANCYRRLNDHDRARSMLAQAQVFLEERIPPDADFLATTRYSREQWFQVLDWLQTL